MNLADITKRMQQQAEKVAVAAKNFKGLSFDDMAAQDDYIHSDSLNVKRKQHGQSQAKFLREPAKGSKWSFPVLVTDVASSVRQHAIDYIPSGRDSNTSAPVLPFAEDAMIKSSNHELSRYDEEEGLTTGAICGQESDDGDLDLQHTSGRSKTKKRNRFMDDLEDRMSKENTPLPVMVSGESMDLLQAQRIDAGGSAKSWIFDLMGRRLPQHVTSAEMAPLARKKRNDKRVEQDDNINVVVSSSILQADELAELNSLKSASPGWLQVVAMLMQEHPRETFILLTLVLCMFAYLHGRLIADDVH
ncbi:hypothetical protein MPSEU_000214400 [Mayamaea pseudoterrestris]|nr:hypothetical protein MPSEU_000214400 [Mayamaea pseudoterrestris]